MQRRASALHIDLLTPGPTEPFLLVRGKLHKRKGTLNVVAERFSALRIDASLVAPPAHNFR
jgi:hypothetical protein